MTVHVTCKHDCPEVKNLFTNPSIKVISATIISIISITVASRSICVKANSTASKRIEVSLPNGEVSTAIQFINPHSGSSFAFSADFSKKHVVSFELLKHVRFAHLSPYQSVFNFNNAVLDTGSPFSVWPTWMKLGKVTKSRVIGWNCAGKRCGYYWSTLHNAYILGTPNNRNSSPFMRVNYAPSYCVMYNDIPKVIVPGYYGKVIAKSDANHEITAFLGNNLWKGMVLTINYRAKSVSVQTEAQTIADICKNRKCVVLPFKMTHPQHDHTGSAGLPVISVLIGGKFVSLVVDTSLPDELLLHENQFPITGLRFTAYRSIWVPGSYAVYNSNCTGTRHLVTVRANSLSLRLPLHTLQYNSDDGEIGASAFAHFGEVIFDFQHNALILRPYGQGDPSLQ